MGIGISTYGEICAFGPSIALPAGGWESATVKIEPSGKVTVMTGVSPHGQGEETTFAQIVADELGVPMDDVLVVHGDTAVVQYGIGTFGSRGTAVGGSALYYALQELKAKLKKFGAMLLETENVKLVGGECVDQATGKSVKFAEMAVAAYHAKQLPPKTEPGLVATHFWEPPNFTFPFGAHLVVTEVDRETGTIAIKRYVCVDDIGRIINPLIVDGQVHGGVAQGLGQALWEHAVYDDAGQLVSGELDGLRAAEGQRHAVDREQPHRDAFAGEPARRERRRRGRHHRMFAGGRELRGGRTLPAGRAAHRYAVDARKDLEADSGGPRMIANPFTYHTPATIDEALAMLKDGEGKILAGGMSLIPLMKLRLASPESVIDLRRIPGLREITEAGGVVRIGAMATHHQIETSPVIRGKCPLLGEAASNIGDIQVRNMGTIGGSAAHADPAADYPAALMALEAHIRLRSASGERTVECARILRGRVHDGDGAGRNCGGDRRVRGRIERRL